MGDTPGGRRSVPVASRGRPAAQCLVRWAAWSEPPEERHLDIGITVALLLLLLCAAVLFVLMARHLTSEVHGLFVAHISVLLLLVISLLRDVDLISHTVSQVLVSLFIAIALGGLAFQCAYRFGASLTRRLIALAMASALAYIDVRLALAAVGVFACIAWALRLRSGWLARHRTPFS